jgi:hypothetical protein
VVFFFDHGASKLTCLADGDDEGGEAVVKGENGDSD